ncbi:MAG: stage III sporulation protein AA, partial [Clostridia bacterium]|nr:stage III sporulation protein AA [Clostridia bacterium]
CALSAVNSGIKIISTCHAASLTEVVKKPVFIKNVFDRYVVLKNGKLGELENIYDGDFNTL